MSRTAPPSVTANRGRAFSIAERFLLVGGLLLFGFLLHRLGLGSVVENLELVGMGVFLIIAQELLAYTANTLGWLAAFTPPRPKIPFFPLLGARIIGDAINYVTPTAGLGGEFIRARLMRGMAQGTQVVASITVAKVSQVVGQIAFVVLGLIVILDEIPLPPNARRGILLGVVVLSGLVAVLVFMQRRGLFTLVWRFAEKIGVAQTAPDLTRQLHRLDAEIRKFHLNANGAFVLSSGLFFLGWVLGVVEVYLILWLLDVPASLELATKIEILSVAFDGMFFFVPAKLGTQEAGKVLIFQTLGLDPSKGLSFGILRHIRELSWSLIGLGMLWWQQRRS